MLGLVERRRREEVWLRRELSSLDGESRISLLAY